MEKYDKILGQDAYLPSEGLVGGVPDKCTDFIIKDHMQLVLPIYYEQKFKRKDPKVWLVGDNAYRNWHYFLKNKVKQHYHALVAEQVTSTRIEGQYELEIEVYLKNPAADASNVASRIEKFSLDALQECGVVVNDNSKYHVGTAWKFKGIDKENPRCVVTLHEIAPS